MDYALIGKNIKAFRKQRGITQEQLAEEADISANFLACIEIGVRHGSFETYVRIANVLGTTLDSIMNGVVIAGTTDALKDEVNYYFDKSSEKSKTLMAKLAKDIYETYN